MQISKQKDSGAVWMKAPEMNPLLTEPEAAQFLGIHTRTIQRWRRLKQGPPYLRIGKKLIRYLKHDLTEWLENKHGR